MKKQRTPEQQCIYHIGKAIISLHSASIHKESGVILLSSCNELMNEIITHIDEEIEIERIPVQRRIQ